MFTLLGFLDYPKLQVPFFLIFMGIYLCGREYWDDYHNQAEPQSSHPMYFFLSHLSFVDFCYSSITVLKMLLSLIARQRTISFAGCTEQQFFFCSSVVTEAFCQQLWSMTTLCLSVALFSTWSPCAGGRAMFLGCSLLLNIDVLPLTILFL